MPQLFNIRCRHRTHSSALADYITDAHLFAATKWNRNDIRAVEVFAENPGGNRISVKPNEQVEERRPVADLNRFGMVNRTEDFLRIIEGIIYPLFKREAGIWLQIVQRNLIKVCKRIALADKDMWLRFEQQLKRKGVFPENFHHHFFIEIT